MAERRLLLVTVERDPPHYPSLRVIFGKVLPAAGWHVDWVLAEGDAEPAWRPPGEVTHVPLTRGRGPLAFAAGERGRAAATAELRQRVRRGEYDAVLVRDDPLLALLFGRAARSAGVPLLLQVSHLKEEEALLVARHGLHGSRAVNVLKGTGGLALRARAVAAADVVLAISEDMGRRLRPRARRVEVLPEGAPAAMLAAPFPTFDQGPVAIYVGTLSRVRRLELLAEVAGIVARLRPDLRIRIVGPELRGGEAAFLRARAAAARGGGVLTVELPVAPEAVPALLRTASVGLAPLPPDDLLRANSPVKLFEYMAAGLPVVATPTPEQQRAVVESGGGRLAPWEPEAFASALVEVVSDPARAAEMGRRGREWVARNRTLEALGEDLVGLLDDLAAAR